MATTGSGVNRPTNSKQKEEDVNRKLQVYGIISGKNVIQQITTFHPANSNTAFQQGKVPSVRPPNSPAGDGPS